MMEIHVAAKTTHHFAFWPTRLTLGWTWLRWYQQMGSLRWLM